MTTATLTKKGGDTTALPVEAPPQVTILQHTPEFIRLPKPGSLCAFTGLSRSAINELILPTPRNDNKPPVRSFCLRQRGAKTGIRVVDYASLRGYILARPEPEAVPTASPAPTPSPTPSPAAPQPEPIAPTAERFECDQCCARFESDDDAVTLYECGECGTRFTQETSSNGSGHSCPGCNKFGAKVSDCGCPECNEGELQQIGSDAAPAAGDATVPMVAPASQA